jgi:hypothetical protein
VDEVQTRRPGGAAIVTARTNARGTYQGHPIPEAVHATLTLVGEGGRWKPVALHISFIAGTSGAPPGPGAGTGPGGKRSAA